MLTPEDEAAVDAEVLRIIHRTPPRPESGWGWALPIMMGVGYSAVFVGVVDRYGWRVVLERFLGLVVIELVACVPLFGAVFFFAARHLLVFVAALWFGGRKCRQSAKPSEPT